MAKNKVGNTVCKGCKRAVLPSDVDASGMCVICVPPIPVVEPAKVEN